MWLHQTKAAAFFDPNTIQQGTPLAQQVVRNVCEGLCIIWLSMKHICYNLLHLFALVWTWRHPVPLHRLKHYMGQSDSSARGTSCYCVEWSIPMYPFPIDQMTDQIVHILLHFIPDKYLTGFSRRRSNNNSTCATGKEGGGLLKIFDHFDWTWPNALMDDNKLEQGLNGRCPNWKTISLDNCLMGNSSNGRCSNWKTI